MVPDTNSHYVRISRFAIVGLLFLAIGACSGCIKSRWPGRHSGFGFRRSCVLSPQPTLQSLLQHLNRNIDILHGWRSSDVRIYARGAGRPPVWLSAYLAVERPRNLRLMASVLGTNEVDLGSNPEQFWFWARRASPDDNFILPHTDETGAATRLPIPFEPEWLMESLGVVPIDGTDMRLEIDPSGNSPHRLISDRVSPQGQMVRKVLLVDPCNGHILEHALYDSVNQLIARARFNDYREEPTYGIVIAHHVELEWPPAGLSMSLDIGHIDANPEAMPSKTWQPMAMAQ